MTDTAPQEAISLIDHLADLLRDKRIGLTTVIAIAEAIAADGRFNIWYLNNIKTRPLSMEERMAKIDEYDCLDELENLTTACIAAIEKFDAMAAYKYDKNDKDRGFKELRELEAALQTFSTDITKAMVVRP